MVTALGATQATSHFAHLRNLEQFLLNHVGDLVHLVERCSRSGGAGDECGLFTEGGEKVFPHTRIERKHANQQQRHQPE